MYSTTTLFTLGFSFYLSLHFICRHIVVHVFKRDETDAYVISCRVVSAIQAIIAVVVGAIIANSCQEIMKDVHWLTNTYLYFGFPYFLYDTWAMYAYNIRLYAQHYAHRNTRRRIKRFFLTNKVMIAHHIILPGVIFPLILMYRKDRGDFFVGVFYMIEMVVPLMSLRAILIQLNMKHTRLYLLTSLSVMAVFFVCRILVFPYLYRAYSIHADIPVWAVPLAIPLKCNISCLAIMAPQVYWFSMMVRMLRNAWSGYDSSHHNTDNSADRTANSKVANGVKLK